MDAYMGILVEVRLELVPKLRGLILDIPLHVFVAWAKVALFRPSRLLVSTHTHDDSGVMMLI